MVKERDGPGRFAGEGGVEEVKARSSRQEKQDQETGGKRTHQRKGRGDEGSIVRVYEVEVHRGARSSSRTESGGRVQGQNQIMFQDQDWQNES